MNNRSKIKNIYFGRICLVQLFFVLLLSQSDPAHADLSEALLEELRTDALRELNLRNCSLQEVHLGSQATVEHDLIYTTVTLEDDVEVIALQPHSIRSRSFQLLTVGRNGDVDKVEPPPPNTYKGSLLGRPETRVAATIDGESICALIRLETGKIWCIQPVKHDDRVSDLFLYAVFSTDDIEPGDWTCGVTESTGNALDLLGDLDRFDETLLLAAQPGSSIAEISLDADFEFFQANGNSVSDTMQDIEEVMNAVNVIYERDTGIFHEIGTILVRTEAADPYSSNAPSTLLNQFRNEWNQNQQNIQRDVAHLMTGKNLNGSTIGIAQLGVICNRSSAYGLSESRFTGNFVSRVGLTAHELGHNWSANHCDCNIMCSGIGGCQGSPTSFSQPSVNAILAHKNSRNCLTLVTDPVENQAPTVNAGPNQTISLPFSAQLAGRVSDDGLPTPPGAVTTRWTKRNGPGTVTFGDAEAVDTTASFSSAGTYTLRLTANDGELSAFDQISITVNESDTTTLVFADFDTDEEGFVYVDDTFRDSNRPAYASGSRNASEGALQVILGGRDNATILNMSGGWRTTFDLSAPNEVMLSFDYELTQQSDYESDEFSQVVVTVDDLQPGGQGDDFVAQIVGNGNGGNPRTTGRETFQVNVGTLPAGEHTLTIGGFNNKKTFNNESTVVLIDNVLVAVSDTPSENQPPTVNAGPNQTISLSASAALDGTVNDDGLPVPPGAVTTRWTKRNGPGTVTFGDAEAVDTTASFSSAGTYTLRLTANDGELSAFDQISITVNESDTTTLVFAEFDTDEEGFGYVDDAFRDSNQPEYASGSHNASEGALEVNLGGVDNATILNMSGGWRTTFDLSAPSEVVVSFDYELTQQPSYERDEFSQVIVTLDDLQPGRQGSDFVAQIVGNGNGGNPRTTGRETFQANVGTLSAGEHTLTIGGFNNKKTFNNESTVVLLDNVRVEVSGSDDPSGEVTVRSRVRGSLDDAEENVQTGRIRLVSSDLEMSEDRGQKQWVGLRFTQLAIPAGARIVSAHVQFTADERSGRRTILEVRGQAADRAASFGRARRNISSRALTRASVSWRVPAWNKVGEAGERQRTPDLSSIVQEVVNRRGWKSGQSLALFLTGSGKRTAESFNGDSSAAAELIVKYEASR